MRHDPTQSYTKYDLQQVKAAADLVQVISGYVRIKRTSGARYVGLCPFHREKNPSFTVNVERQRFHCFGCGADGDVFDFIGRIEGLATFPARVARLAEAAGIVPLRDSRSIEDRRRWKYAQAAAPALAAAAADWAHGLRLWAERHKAGLCEVMRWAWQNDADALGDAIGAMIAEIPQAALDPESADPRLVVGAYLRATRECPEAAAAVLRRGREDREHAEAVTHQIVDMLARAQDRRAA